jgi:uncharacterized membrane protein
VWARARDSLWFVPSVAALIGGVLAVAAVQIPTPRPESRLAWVWLLGGGAEGARGVLTAIAGGLITVTGTTFSVTIVALQLASSQFTPRLLRSFVADRVNQAVLGVFIGTFTYTLLVLRTIHSTGSGAETFVPQVGVTVALVLLLVSIGALIVFVNHTAQSIQASVILRRETERTLAQIAAIFPQRVGEPARPVPGPAATLPPGPPAVVTAAESGYLQAVHAKALWRAAGHGRGGGPVTVRMELHVGAFAFPGRPLASVWPAEAADDVVIGAIREALVLGPERTPEQDVEYGLMELSDIAVKALSPGINDPTTATHAIDRLTEVLAALATRERPDAARTSPDGRVHLLVRDTPFERAAGLAFDQIRHFGADNPAIAKKLLEALGGLGSVTPPAARAVLAVQVEAVARAARREIDDPVDRDGVERLAAAALAAVRDADPAPTPPRHRDDDGDAQAGPRAAHGLDHGVDHGLDHGLDPDLDGGLDRRLHERRAHPADV